MNAGTIVDCSLWREKNKSRLNGLLAGSLSSVQAQAEKLLGGKEGKKEAWSGEDMLPPQQSQGYQDIPQEENFSSLIFKSPSRSHGGAE